MLLRRPPIQLTPLALESPQATVQFLEVLSTVQFLELLSSLLKPGADTELTLGGANFRRAKRRVFLAPPGVFLAPPEVISSRHISY